MLIEPVQERKRVVHLTVGDAAFTVILYWLKIYVALEIFCLGLFCGCVILLCANLEISKTKGIFFRS